jgi:hypothetical protein
MCSSSIARAYSLLRALATPLASTRRLLRSSLHPVRRYNLSHRLCSSHTIAAPCTYYPHSCTSLCAVFILHAPSYASHTDLSTLVHPLRVYEPFPPLTRVFTLARRLCPAHTLPAPYANQAPMRTFLICSLHFSHALSAPYAPFMHYCTVRIPSPFLTRLCVVSAHREPL